MNFDSSLRGAWRPFALAALAACLAACGGGGSADADADATVGTADAQTTIDTEATMAAGRTPDESRTVDTLAAPGNCYVPSAARAATVITPTTVIGNGTPASCTSAAVVAAVAKGGAIKFNCGPNPVVIPMTATAKVFNNKPDVVLDGGNKVTLSGRKSLRILYQNTCDPKQVYTSSRCDIQDTPRTTVQNITLADGNATGQNYGRADVGGGGAIFARGGKMKVVNASFLRNQCAGTGNAEKGGALRVTGMTAASPAYVVGSKFGGTAGQGNQCSAGGAISALAASVSVYNSVIGHNHAIGGGSSGGGGGGGIAHDGRTIVLNICGSTLHDNSAKEGGGAIFFTSNDFTGTMSIKDSVLRANLSMKYETAGYPGIFIKTKAGQPVISGSTLTR